MDSQILHHHHHDAVELHQGVGGGEEGQHHEKKSVLKKVKAKAKKIKDTITKHGHGHDHEDDHEDEEDEEDEGVVEDPQIQGAPLYEGAAMRSGVGGERQHQDVGIGMPTGMHDHNQAPRETTSRLAAVDTGFTSTTKEKVDNSGTVAPNTTMSLSPSGLQKDPHAPKDKTNLHTPNSEVKVADPARRGNEEASQESQIFDSFAKMKVDEHEPNRTDLSPRTKQGGGDQSSYTQKLSAVSSAMGGKAVAAKDYMASKLWYGETTEDNKNTNPLEYGRKIAYTVTEKLKPGEEDRALSEVISEAFNRRKDEVIKVGGSAFGRRRQQEMPRGRVTESEELTRRLGKDDSELTEKSSVARTAEAAGRSVVDMVKESVGSWLGKTGDQSAAPSQPSISTSQGVEGRRQQEHGGTGAEVRTH